MGKMKVSFITKQNVSNYGSILQTYAMQETIQHLGCESEIINYVREDLKSSKSYNTVLKNQPKWNKNIVTRFIYRIIQFPNYAIMNSKFEKFRKKLYKNVSKLYTSNEELKNDPPIADIYCAGSDQIWGTNGNSNFIDKAYFLDFVPENSKCISYASSIGLSKVDENFSKQLKNLLSKYQTITVREETAIEILKRQNIEAKLVLDPTLLLKKEKWDELTLKNKEKSKYILVYQLHSNKKFEKYVKEFSDKVGLKILRVSPAFNQINRIGKFKYLPSPEQFLTYIKYAEYIITDSFHGTVFSLIFNKKFIDINPGETSTRIISMLKTVNLEERLLCDYSDFSLINKEIDWEKTNKILAKEREKSINIFKESIFEEEELTNIDNMNKNNCTGCRACEQLCPVNAIEIVENKEGFLEPHVNKDKCIKCKLCVNKCPQIQNKDITNNTKVYAAKLKNEKEILESSSGGAFAAIAKAVLNRNGVIFGCAFSDDLVAEHISIKDEKELSKLKGSKYVQSDTKHTYSEVKKLLEKDINVLYTGTPCQIAGLKAYLGKEYKNLFTVDFVCHGVPSPKLFKKYKKWLEEKNKAKLIEYYFREKEKNSWGLNSKMVFSNNNKKFVKYQRAKLDPYYSSFLKGHTYRECCYKCKYANRKRISDFTIADFWGIEKVHPEFKDEKGISMIIVNTEKAENIFNNSIKEQLNLIESNIENAAKHNLNLNQPFSRNNQRNFVYIDIDKKNFKVYSKENLKFKKDFKEVLKKYIPKKVKQILKS